MNFKKLSDGQIDLDLFINLEKIEPLEKKRKLKNKYGDIVSFLIKPEQAELNEKNSAFWSREVRILTKLMKTFPEEDFWKTLSIEFKLNSLAFLITDRGQEILNQKYKLFKFSPTIAKAEEVKLLDVKVGEDIEIKKNKNKSISSFLT